MKRHSIENDVDTSSSPSASSSIHQHADVVKDQFTGIKQAVDSHDSFPPAQQHAERKPHITTVHGIQLCDPYHWLRERENPDVHRYLELENQYFQKTFNKRTSALQQSLFKEMVSHIKETDLSVPVRRGPFLYYYRTEKGKQYRIYCRRRIDPSSSAPSSSSSLPEEILLDLNQLADQFQSSSSTEAAESVESESNSDQMDHLLSPLASTSNGRQQQVCEQHSQPLPSTTQVYFDLGIFSVSPDHKILAYAIDTTGDEIFTLYFKDLETGLLLANDVLEKVSSGLEWANDSQTG